MTREAWLKPGSTFISLARRELDPAGWVRMDKVVVDSWEMNMRMPVFSAMVEQGQFSRDRLHARNPGGGRGRQARPHGSRRKDSRSTRPASSHMTSRSHIISTCAPRKSAAASGCRRHGRRLTGHGLLPCRIPTKSLRACWTPSHR